MKHIFCITALVAALGFCHAEENEAVKLDFEQVFNTLQASAVRVEYTLKFDNNTPPGPMMDDKPCPNCGSFHTITSEELLTDERPYERMGWVVAPDTVLIDDPGISARFIESIRLVLPDGQKIAANQNAVFMKSPALLLKTEAPIPNVAPLVFAAANQPLQKGLLAGFTKPNTEWNLDLAKVNLGDILPTFNARRKLTTFMDKGGLFLSETGAPLGFLMTGADWNAETPLAIPPFDNGALMLMRDFIVTDDHIANLLNNGIHLITLNFRSPRQTTRESRYSWRDSDDSNSSTVQYAIALHIAPGRLLVLKRLSAKQTARLESVTLLGSDGQNLPAEFAASLENFNAFIVTAPDLASAPLAIYPGDPRELTGTPVQLAIVTAQGPQLIIKHDRSRLTSFSESWKDFITAELPGDARNTFVFTPQGQLITFPLSRRDKSTENHYNSFSEFSAKTFATLIQTPPAGEIDPTNIPLSERDENRIAWLGVELQPLTAQLAQEMKIAHLVIADDHGYSSDDTGGIIAFIYPNSPAEKAGLKTGDILLRIHAEGRNLPYGIDVSEDYDMSDFPWTRYDSIPSEYFDRIPTPWPAVENAVNTTLTSIGFDKKIRLECIVDGERKEIPMTVELSPDTYTSAPQYVAESLGASVRDLTFEVRHYFRRAPEDPGVIVARVEPGQHAAVAGIRPYELILKVNDVPVHNIAEFEEQLKDKQDLQLTIRRMNRERIVRINLAEKVPPPQEDKPGLLDALRSLVP